jgi:hypothetical protein
MNKLRKFIGLQCFVSVQFGAYVLLLQPLLKKLQLNYEVTYYIMYLT